MSEAKEVIKANFENIIEDFHSILTSEVKSIAVTNNSYLSNAISETNNLMIGINSFGLLSSEVAETLINYYNTKKDFRRIWGSISTQFGFSLLGKYDTSTKEFAEFIVKYIDLSASENEIPSVTQAELLSDRIGTSAYDGASLLSPNDFWIVCIFFARLTWNHNPLFQEVVDKLLVAMETPDAQQKK